MHICHILNGEITHLKSISVIYIIIKLDFTSIKIKFKLLNQQNDCKIRLVFLTQDEKNT